MHLLHRIPAWPALVIVAIGARPLPSRAQAAYEHLQTFSSLVSQVRLNYVDTVSVQQLVRGAITGMLASLDPHSRFQSRDELARMAAWHSGRLAGAGLVLEDVEGSITVQSVLHGSAGARAGINAGDRIVALNDTTLAGRGAMEVQPRLLGERGSRLRLTIERGSRLEPDTVSVRLRLEPMRPRAVYMARALGPGSGYVRLEQFLPEAGRELREAIERVLGGRGERRLVLDLRGNPGGDMHAAVAVAELFLPESTLVFRTTGRHRDVQRESRTTRNGQFRDIALVVLVDGASASASEAVAASLQDHDRAVLVGRRTFGKALMQRLLDLPPNGDGVWLTVAHIVSPSGRVIQRSYQGLTSDQYRRSSRGQAGDTTTYLTAGGRVVRGGGGVAPDLEVTMPHEPPAWFVAAREEGLDHAVSDSVAARLPADERTREAWMTEPSRWHEQLAVPFLARVRERLGVRAMADSATTATIARVLAGRAVEVRWGPAALEEFLVRTDPDVAAAVAAFPRLPALLAAPARPAGQ